MATVLVVDDEPLLLDAYTRILTRHGCNTIPASKPTQALEIVKRRPPINVALLDVSMPEMRGTYLVHRIAQLSPGTACVLMTGGIVESGELPLGVPLVRKLFHDAI